MRDVEIFLEQVTAWAREEANGRAVLVVGSHARTATRADEWSDVDIVVLADDPSASSTNPPGSGGSASPC